MPKLLHINSSLLYRRSVSRQVTGGFVSQHGQDRDAFLAPHLQAVRTHVQTI